MAVETKKICDRCLHSASNSIKEHEEFKNGFVLIRYTVGDYVEYDSFLLCLKCWEELKLGKHLFMVKNNSILP